MDQDTHQVRWLPAVAIILCALMIGCNVLLMPQVTLAAVVKTDLPSAAQAAVLPTPDDTPRPEGYEPESVEQTVLVNLNTVDAKELGTLPGIGPAITQKVIAYRGSAGAFQNTEELIQIGGIGEKTFKKFKELVAVEVTE